MKKEQLSIKRTRGSAKYGAPVVREMSDKAVREAYTRMRDIAHKRLQRLDEARRKAVEAGNPRPKYDIEKIDLPKAKGKTTAELRELLPELSRWVNDPRATPAGLAKWEKMMTERLAGTVSGITQGTLSQFGNFMDASRHLVDQKVINSSDPLVRVYEWATEHHINPETVGRKFNEFVQSEKEFKEMEEILLDLMDKPTTRGTKRKRITSADVEREFRKRYGQTGNDPDHVSNGRPRKNK